MPDNGDDISLPSYVSPENCEEHVGLGGDTTFQLPLDADLLFLESRGSRQGGKVVISVSSTVPEDRVLVHVNSRIHPHGTSNALAKICKVERPQSQHGVGIYVGVFDQIPQPCL